MPNSGVRRGEEKGNTKPVEDAKDDDEAPVLYRVQCQQIECGMDWSVKAYLYRCSIASKQ